MYDESYLESDISACLDILRESDFGFVHQVLSYTRRHSDSMTERTAKKDSTFIFGDLKMHLDYAQYFLSKKELKSHIQKRINIFYILFARHILTERSIEIYHKHKQELDRLGLPFSRMKLLKRIFLEMVRMPIINFIKSRLAKGRGS
jgi:hypothetical protein